jgi:hypothetical protein
MTSCIASACPVDNNKFDVDAVYISLSRCGLDEESFNALFQYVVLAADGVDPVRAYASYCTDVRQENVIREHMNRRQLSTVTLTTMFDLVEEYEIAVRIARFSDLQTFGAAEVAEAIEWVASTNGHARYDVEADPDFVRLRFDRQVSIMVGGAA